MATEYMTVNELKKLATKYKLYVPSGLKKLDLIDVINEELEKKRGVIKLPKKIEKTLEEMSPIKPVKVESPKRMEKVKSRSPKVNNIQKYKYKYAPVYNIVNSFNTIPEIKEVAKLNKIPTPTKVLKDELIDIVNSALEEKIKQNVPLKGIEKVASPEVLKMLSPKKPQQPQQQPKPQQPQQQPKPQQPQQGPKPQQPQQQPKPQQPQQGPKPQQPQQGPKPQQPQQGPKKTGSRSKSLKIVSPEEEKPKPQLKKLSPIKPAKEIEVPIEIEVRKFSPRRKELPRMSMSPRASGENVLISETPLTFEETATELELPVLPTSLKSPVRSPIRSLPRLLDEFGNPI